MFARKSKDSFEEIKKQFPHIAFSHSSPLYRNLSEDDRILQDGKVNNISLALKCISPVILSPSKVFSYWKLIGNPTRFRGFKKGMMLVSGKPVASIGGGLCALSNLIYWMTLHTNLSVIERYRHSYDVFPDSGRTLPFGSGATCVYNYRDLVIANETDEEFALLIWIENNRLCGQWRTKNPVHDEYQVYQKSHWITGEAPGVYLRHNVLFRKHWKICDGKKEFADDYEITENHALMMYEPLLEK